MVRSGLPQGIAPAHTLEANEDILHRVVKRVAHVQAAGDIRRWDHNCVGPLRGARPAGKSACALPALVQLRFDLDRPIGLVQHGSYWSAGPAATGRSAFIFGLADELGYLPRHDAFYDQRQVLIQPLL